MVAFRFRGGEVVLVDLRGPTCSVKDLVAPFLAPRSRFVVGDWRLALAIMHVFEGVEACANSAKPPVPRCDEEPNVDVGELVSAYSEGVGSRLAALGYEFDYVVAPSMSGAMLRGVYSRLYPLGIGVAAVSGYVTEPADEVGDPAKYLDHARALLLSRGLLVGRSTVDAVAAAMDLIDRGVADRVVAPILSGPCMD